jgi:gamma-glutamylcyclotransferase (GGCT)/AIG2-like uncharacterized protein YtfP
MERLPIFVYGTLKKGEILAGGWPHPPLLVEPAIARGNLYDLGPYPALVDGSDAVLGELWHIPPEHFSETVAALDRIEHFGVGEVDLYVRRIISVTLQDGTIRRAQAYFLADPTKVREHQRVVANHLGVCEWLRHRPPSE